MPTSGADWPMQYETVKSQRRATSTDFHRLPQSTALTLQLSTKFQQIISSAQSAQVPKCRAHGLVAQVEKEKTHALHALSPRQNARIQNSKKNAKRNAERIWKTPKDAKRCQKQIELQRMKPPRMAKRCCLSFTWRYPLKTRAICEDSPPSMGNEVMMGSITCNVQQLKQLKQLKDRLQLLKGSEGIWRDLKGSEGYGFVHLLGTGLSL